MIFYLFLQLQGQVHQKRQNAFVLEGPEDQEQEGFPKPNISLQSSKQSIKAINISTFMPSSSFGHLNSTGSLVSLTAISPSPGDMQEVISQSKYNAMIGYISDVFITMNVGRQVQAAGPHANCQQLKAKYQLPTE